MGTLTDCIFPHTEPLQSLQCTLFHSLNCLKADTIIGGIEKLRVELKYEPQNADISNLTLNSDAEEVLEPDFSDGNKYFFLHNLKVKHAGNYEILSYGRVVSSFELRIIRPETGGNYIIIILSKSLKCYTVVPCLSS